MMMIGQGNKRETATKIENCRQGVASCNASRSASGAGD